MFKAILVRIVAASARFPWLVLAIGLSLAAAGSVYVAQNFAVDTDINDLISPNLPWRQNEIAYFNTFPRQDPPILAVIQAPTPELAENAADRLTKSLQGAPHIREARRPAEELFFARNGLLFLSQSGLQAKLKQLSDSAMMLGTLAADPSLRGVMNTVMIGLRAVQARRVSMDDLAEELNALAVTASDALNGRRATFSWRAVTTGTKPAPADLRRFVEIFPVLDYTALEPGAKAAATINKTVADLGLSSNNVSVRLTGPVPISDQEFATIRQGGAVNGIITVGSILIILWLALHSGRIILAVFVSLFVGLAITAALGLVMAHAFNPISIAFFVLFVGIGVDFGLQFSVSYRAERYERDDLMGALAGTAAHTGGRLALAAFATAAGFLSFLPTPYSGLSELGGIAGVGMLIAFLTSITVLPALLRLLNPPAEPHPLGYAFLRPADRFLERNRRLVLLGMLTVVLGGAPLLYWLRFDLNPMDLRSPKGEAVATYLELRKNPEVSGSTAEVIEPSLAAADATAKKLAALPEVSRVMTLSSFVPNGQDVKLPMIQQAAKGLIPVLAPEETRPAPADAENIAGLEAAAAALDKAGASGTGAGAAAAKTLAPLFLELAKASPETRAKFAAALVLPLEATLSGLAQSLGASPVTIETLPQELAGNWVAPGGNARVSITPKGNTSVNHTRTDFVNAVMSVAPNATGEPVGIEKAGETIVGAFVEAAGLALLSIAILLWLSLRRVLDVLLTLIPLILAGMLTLEITVVFDLPLNFANIIALPVLLGVGVAFKIYYMVAWRAGMSNLLSSPLTRAVFFSGLTTAVAFGSLWFSNHPGTASMGRLLAIALGCTMVAAVLFQPLLMGPPRTGGKRAPPPAAPAVREHERS